MSERVVNSKGVVERGGREAFKGLVDVLVEFCISSLVIICFVKSFYELADRFFGPAVSRSAQRRVASAGLAFKAFRRRCAKRERRHGRHASFGEKPSRRRQE